MKKSCVTACPVEWPDDRGISGRIRVEWVAGSPWNRWSDAYGMGGQMTVESAVVAPLAAHSEEREQAMSGYLAIAGFHGVPRLLMDEELWQRTARSYAAALRGWREGRRVIAIVQTDQPTVPSKAQALNVALMVVSDEWIPVESGYEAVIEALLRDQGRRFIKPMRFDAEQEQVFPDFWLMDVGAGRELPMEVYGRQDPKYLARKEVKCAYYTRHYGPTGWWSWDASADPRGLSIPAFPPARHP